MAETTVEVISEDKDIIQPLTDPERNQLSECESIIKQGLTTFLDVGRALAQIRERRLYRETHKTFERYCKDVWDLGRATAYRKIDGYKVVRILEEEMSATADKMSPIGDKNSSDTTSPIGDKNSSPAPDILLPMNEAQARKLTRLAPENTVEAWNLVREYINDGEKLTAALVGRAVKQVGGEAAVKKRNLRLQQLDDTMLVSRIFTRQFKVMETIINEERNSGWKTSSKKETIFWLKELLRLALEDTF